MSLSREQFFAILLLSILLFLFLDGPAWRHLRDSHTVWIVGSYGIIPVLVAVLQWKRYDLQRRGASMSGWWGDGVNDAPALAAAEVGRTRDQGRSRSRGG